MIPRRRERLRIVRMVYESLPPESLERDVAIRYMLDYAEIDIREELAITKRALQTAKDALRVLLIAAGIQAA